MYLTCLFPALEVTVALYLLHVAEGASSFAAIKTTSAAIAYYQKINLFEHNPTISHLASFVRAAFARRLGTAPKQRKAPFLWADVMRFAVAYLTGHPAYCHLAVVPSVLFVLVVCVYLGNWLQ
jgi:hypothetical protein